MAAEIKEYAFRSVGQTTRDLLQTPGRRTKNEIPVGFKTPLQYSETTDSPFEMHISIEDQIADNFKNLILTNEGERVVQTNFGANILPLAFELTNSDVDNEIMQRIKANVATFMPYINLINFRPFNVSPDDPGHAAKLGFVVTFNIPNLSTKTRAVEIFLNAVG